MATLPQFRSGKFVCNCYLQGLSLSAMNFERLGFSDRGTLLGFSLSVQWEFFGL